LKTVSIGSEGRQQPRS